jgi:regulator of sirC expression with transglutaminase-like and TPR domain
VEFREFAQRPDAELDPVLGALLISRDAHPRLSVEAEREKLLSLAEPLRGRGLAGASNVAQALALADHIYGRLGFRGNVDEYYDPENSHLSCVVARRMGIPITLALVYCAIAGELGVPARGVGFPGHFLVRIEGDPPVFVDPFDSGCLLNRAGLAALWARIQGARSPVDPRWLEPAGPRAILVRVLMNLRGAHAARGDFPALLVALDRALELVPDSPQELRDRGLVSLRLGSKEAACSDLERYLVLAPEAGDVPEIRRLVADLAEMRSMLN